MKNTKNTESLKLRNRQETRDWNGKHKGVTGIFSMSKRSTEEIEERRLEIEFEVLKFQEEILAEYGCLKILERTDELLCWHLNSNKRS